VSIWWDHSQVLLTHASSKQVKIKCNNDECIGSCLLEKDSTTRLLMKNYKKNAFGNIKTEFSFFIIDWKSNS
jgi:hypothetical protein